MTITIKNLGNNTISINSEITLATFKARTLSSSSNFIEIINNKTRLRKISANVSDFVIAAEPDSVPVRQTNIVDAIITLNSFIGNFSNNCNSQSPAPTPPTPAAAQIPLPRMRVFAETRDESYYDEENDVQVIKIANRLKMDLYSPHDIEQFNSFFPRLCFFAVIGKKWQVITKSQTGASYDDGSYTIFPQEIPTLPVTFGKDQIVFESFEDFAKKFNINRFIINYDNKNIQIGSFRGYGRNNRVIRFGIGLVFNPNKTEVKEYTVGQGLHYIRLGEFHAAIHHNRPLPVENGKLYFVSRIN